MIFADPETNTVGSGPFTALSQTQSWIDNRHAAFRDHGLAWYALRLCESGELIGNCGMLRGRSTYVEPELGYMISLAHQGRGYATEAATATMHECGLSSFSRVWATIRPANIASRRIAERLGMTIDRTETDDRGPLIYYVKRLTQGAVTSAQ